MGTKTVKLSLSIMPEPTGDQRAREQNNNHVPEDKSSCSFKKVTVLLQQTLKFNNNNNSCCQQSHDHNGEKLTGAEQRKKRRKLRNRSRSQPPPDPSELHELLRTSLEENNVCYRNTQRYADCSMRINGNYSKLNDPRIIVNEFDGLNGADVNHFWRRAKKTSHTYRSHSQGRILELLASKFQLVPQCNHGVCEV